MTNTTTKEELTNLKVGEVIDYRTGFKDSQHYHFKVLSEEEFSKKKSELDGKSEVGVCQRCGGASVRTQYKEDQYGFTAEWVCKDSACALLFIDEFYEWA